MLVSIFEYREDDATDAVKSEGSVEPDRSAEDYFNADDLTADEGWERIEQGDRTLLRREIDIVEVTAISVPRDDEPTEPDEHDRDQNNLPGKPIMLRKEGDEHYLSNAEIIEAQDRNP